MYTPSNAFTYRRLFIKILQWAQYLLHAALGLYLSRSVWHSIIDVSSLALPGSTGAPHLYPWTYISVCSSAEAYVDVYPHDAPMFITSTCPDIYYISIICFCEKLWLKRNWDTLTFVRPGNFFYDVLSLTSELNAMPLNTDYLHCGTANRRRLLFLMLPILCNISRCIIYEINGYRNFVPQIVCKLVLKFSDMSQM